MNIFMTNRDPAIAAQHLDDLRLNKMILETAQILSTVLQQEQRFPELYKPTHRNHPCVLWVAASLGNAQWTLEYFKALLQERNYRFPTKPAHKCQTLYVYFETRITGNLSLFPARWLTHPANCSGFSDNPDITTNYRRCLANKWLNDVKYPKWTRRGCPAWFKE